MVDCTLTLGLSKVLYRLIAYVQRGVVVSVIAVSASQAVESRVVAVPCVHVSAMVAFLARVGRVNHHSPNPVLRSLIRCELLQLGEGPLVEHVAARSAGLCPFSRLTADVRQILECYDADIRSVRQLFVRLVAGGSIPGYQGMILTDDSIRSLANRYPRNDEEYAFVSLFKESHLGDKNLALGAAPDDYDGRYRKVAAIAWLLAREGRSALRSFES